MTWRIDEIDQELVSIGFLRDVRNIVVAHVSVEGDGSRLDGDTTLLLIISGVCEPCLSCSCSRDDTSSLDKGVGKGGFSMVDVAECISDKSSKPEQRSTYAMTEILRMLVTKSCQKDATRHAARLERP